MRQRFASDIIDRAQKHAALHPDRGRAAIYVDVRGQALEPEVAQRLRMRIVDGSGGAVHDGDLIFIEGTIDAAADTSRYGELGVPGAVRCRHCTSPRAGRMGTRMTELSGAPIFASI